MEVFKQKLSICFDQVILNSHICSLFDDYSPTQIFLQSLFEIIDEYFQASITIQPMCQNGIIFNINIVGMHHFPKVLTNRNRSKSKTPTKPDKPTKNLANTSPRKKREQAKHDESHQALKQKELTFVASKISKTKETYNILQSLEHIYNELTFDRFDIFPISMIDNAKKNIEDLLLYLGHEPTCRYHKDLLNLYCDNDKAVICVSCVYKSLEHKPHKIKSIQSVQKVIDLQTIRCEQKTKHLVHQLQILKDEIEYMTKQVGQNYKTISNYTISIVDESIRQLTTLKTEMEKKLSLAYRRTTTVINRYNESLESMINRLQKGLQQAMVMSPLSKYLLLKEFTIQNDLIEHLIYKFNQNKEMMTQWNKSTRDFDKVVLNMRNIISKKIDSFVVTQF